MIVKVKINGSGENPWARMGMRCNPFPKIAKAEWAGLEYAFQQLDSEPIPSEAALRQLLAKIAADTGGDASSPAFQEFVAICVANYKPGERTTFDLEIPVDR